MFVISILEAIGLIFASSFGRPKNLKKPNSIHKILAFVAVTNSKFPAYWASVCFVLSRQISEKIYHNYMFKSKVGVNSSNLRMLLL